MQTLKLAKRLLKCLPLLAAMIATVIGMFIARDLYQTSLDSQVKPTAQLPAEQNSPQPLTVLGAVSPCISPYIYTSLPPKCRTSDGSFIQASGSSPYVILIPGAK